MDPFLAAAIQMNSQPDLVRNMDQAGEAVARAAREGARFVTLPENFAFLGSETEKHRLAEPISEAVVAEIPKWAREHGIWLLAGGFPVRVGSGKDSGGGKDNGNSNGNGSGSGSGSGKDSVGGGGKANGKGKAKVYNRAIVADPSGDIIARYDKIHLFDVAISAEDSYRESDLVEPGRPEPVVCDILGEESNERSEDAARCESDDRREVRAGIRKDEWKDERNDVRIDDQNDAKNVAWKMKRNGVRVGLTICYDVRFSELYRRLSEMGADILCVPAAFTRPTGEAHWETLLRARAIENSCYVIAPAQTGRHGKNRLTYGHSLIIDPWGRILADGGTSPGTIFAEINPKLVRDIRKKLPSIHHRVL